MHWSNTGDEFSPIWMIFHSLKHAQATHQVISSICKVNIFSCERCIACQEEILFKILVSWLHVSAHVAENGWSKLISDNACINYLNIMFKNLKLRLVAESWMRALQCYLISYDKNVPDCGCNSKQLYVKDCTYLHHLFLTLYWKWIPIVTNCKWYNWCMNFCWQLKIHVSAMTSYGQWL